VTEKLLFAPTHEWVRVESRQGGKVATVGISKFAIEQLSDLVFLDLPATGRQVNAGDSFGEVESVKSVSDLYAPVSGEVVEVNASLKDKLETLAQDPYNAGWMVKIRMTDESELSNLLNEAAYQRQCEEEH
jgi:glycine cleavage system H protein